MVEFLGVRLAVVNASAGYLRIEFADSVPVARHRTDGCGIALIVKLVQLVHQRTGCGAPIGECAVYSLVCAPAEKAVDIYIGVFVDIG